MKNFYLSILLFTIFISHSFAQNTFPSSGNVGIGTMNPVSALQIVGGGFTLGTSALATNADGTLSIGNINNSYSPNTNNWTGYGSNLVLSGGGYSTLAFHHSGVRVDFIRSGFGTIQLGYDGGWGPANIGLPNGIWNSGGKVGIGTTTPSAALDIGGLIQISSINSSTPPSDLAYGLFPYGGIGLGIFSGATDASQGLGIWTNPGGQKKEVMRILSGGNVGIGTTSPDAKLTVNGTIHSKEVKVDLNVPGPDYVFEKDYKLKTLAEVQKYIAVNKHLPEIPSAKVMEQNGVDLSNMNMQLLKKVEELTLYLIEKDKSEKEQAIKFNALEKQVSTLLKRNNK